MNNKTLVWQEQGIGEFVVQGTKLGPLAPAPPAEQTFEKTLGHFPSNGR